MEYKYVWIFCGSGNSSFPSAVFEDFKLAENWIQRHKLTGVLTEYPVNIPVYDWAKELGYLKVRNQEFENAKKIQSFSSAHLNHFHYTDGLVD